MDKRTKAWAAVKIAAFALLTTALFAPAKDAAAQIMYVHVEPDSYLNARSKPRTGDIEAKLDRGQAVDVTEIRAGWATIVGWGETWICYVDADYLSENPIEEPIPCDPTEMRTTAEKVRLRACPGGRVVRRLKKGSTVTVVGWVMDGKTLWAELEDGFIMAKFLEAMKCPKQAADLVR